MRYLLDTNVISEMARHRRSEAVVDRFRLRQHECAIPTPVWHELMYGVERLEPGPRRDVLARYVSEVIGQALPVIAYDEQAADWHARERARLEGIGRPRPFVDGMIASVAATLGLVLVTRNGGDFSGFDGLQIENWFA